MKNFNKNFLAILSLCLCMAFLLISCGNDDDATPNEPVNDSFIRYKFNNVDVMCNVVAASYYGNEVYVRGILNEQTIADGLAGINQWNNSPYIPFKIQIDFQKQNNLISNGTLYDIFQDEDHPTLSYFLWAVYPNESNTYFNLSITESNEQFVKGNFNGVVRPVYDGPVTTRNVTEGEFEIYYDDLYLGE